MNAYSKPDLWKRIDAYNFDQPGVVLPFSKRLARENGWTEEYAGCVIEEYKRFIYLTCVSNEIVTPSVDVDQVWHLHMVYTRDYWQRFCRDTLGREIHHQPTEGGAAEQEKFREAYERTLLTYRAEFDQQPPSDVWPDADTRFRPSIRLPEVYVVPKGQARFAVLAATLVVVESVAFAAGVTFDVIVLTSLLGLGMSYTHTIGWRRAEAKGQSGGCGGGAGTGCGGDGGGCGGCGG